MPQKRKPKQNRDEVIGYLRKIVRDKSTPIAYRAWAIYQLGLLDQLWVGAAVPLGLQPEKPKASKPVATEPPLPPQTQDFADAELARYNARKRQREEENNGIPQSPTCAG
jgi:hypothetical protein